MMTRTFGAAFLFLALCSQLGCPAPQKLFDKGISYYAEAILPELEVYVDADLKASRITPSTAKVILDAGEVLKKKSVAVDEADKAAAVVCPAYEKYIREDILLKERTKEIRLQTSAGLRSLIQTMKDRGR